MYGGVLPRSRAALVPLAFALASLTGCGTEEAEATPEPAPAVPLSGCQVETRADAIAPGLTKTGDGGVTAELLEVVPAMPARGDNRWTLALSDGGTALDGAEITPVPWMPDHGHGTTVDAEVTPLGDGQYEIDSLNLWMPGLWEITFDIAGPTADVVVFSLCIEG